MVSKCRACGSELTDLFTLGTMAFTGRFPKPDEVIPSGELGLALCEHCGLVQLPHKFDPGELYREDYGYRSSLNSSMASHLSRKAFQLNSRYQPKSVLDIGSNDGTTLNAFLSNGVTRLVGVDPIASFLSDSYQPGISIVSDFFSAESLEERDFGTFDLCTSISMFYDLEEPVEFANTVYKALNPDGIWHLEQSYLPLMLRNQGFDTICHEHLEYYSLTSLRAILRTAGFEIIRCRQNGINGGSFELDAVKSSSVRARTIGPEVEFLLEQERRWDVHKVDTFQHFFERILLNREDLRNFLERARQKGPIAALGASTKGNVLIQFCGLEDFSDVVGEINPDKFGHVTPGSRIPIVTESEVLEGDFRTTLILPWHFRESFVTVTEGYRSRGGSVVFPLPYTEVI